MLRVGLLSGVCALAACDSAGEASNDVPMPPIVNASWIAGMPEGVDTTQLHSDYTAADFPDMDFDGECGRAFHIVERDEPLAYWIRCDFVPGGSDLFLYEMDQGQVTQALAISSMRPIEG